MKSITDIPLHNQTVFLRVDFNVPLDDNQQITEDGRIKAALRTIQYLIDKGAKTIIASHLGRPKGQVKDELRMHPVAKRLSELLSQDVHYVDECIGDQVDRMKEKLQAGDVMLLENLRFHSEEKKNDLAFAKELAKDIDVYITDAFGVSHREHASVHALPSLIFDKGYGFLMQQEMEALNKINTDPDQPFVVVIGGVKISDKVGVMKALTPLADIVLVGGGVANTFAKGLGYDIGASIYDSDSVSEDQEGVDYVQVAKEIYNRFESETPAMQVTSPDGNPLTKVQMPLDFVAAPSVEEGAETRVVKLGEELPDGWLLLDIGPETQKLYASILRKAQTVFWNGPMGLFEMEPYSHGSRAVAQATAEAQGYTVLGGGDTGAVVEAFDFKGKYDHVSTGGSASLVYLAEGSLPGIDVLD